jgi:hypothetical protein
MDKKAKKRLEIVQGRLGKLRQQLAGARQQLDDPDEVTRLKKEIEVAQQEVEKIKSGG